MLILRLIIIFFAILSLGITHQGFCASGSSNSGSVHTGSKIDNPESILSEADPEIKTPKIQAIEKNLQKLILEFAKIQGNNSLKSIGQSFKKVNPDSKSIISTYTSLQGQFNKIKNSIIEEGLEDSVRGDILIPYCEYMIEAIEKKKENLE